MEVSLNQEESETPGVFVAGSCPGCWFLQPCHKAADALLLSLMQSSLSILIQTSCLECWASGDRLSVPKKVWGKN